MKVHQFDSTGEAYDASQSYDEISKGDVLVVADEKVVGFLFAAWPVAVTKEAGNFHRSTVPFDEFIAKNSGDDPYVAESIAAAQAEAKKLSLELAS